MILCGPSRSDRCEIGGAVSPIDRMRTSRCCASTKVKAEQGGCLSSSALVECRYAIEDNELCIGTAQRSISRGVH